MKQVAYTYIFFVVWSVKQLSGCIGETVEQKITDIERLFKMYVSISPIDLKTQNVYVGKYQTGELFCDQGLFQAYVAHHYAEVYHARIYLLYETMRYALEILHCCKSRSIENKERILHVNLLCNEFVYLSWYKLASRLLWFRDNEHYYTPHIMCRLLFEFAFLRDIAYGYGYEEKQFQYGPQNKWELCKAFYYFSRMREVIDIRSLKEQYMQARVTPYTHLGWLFSLFTDVPIKDEKRRPINFEILHKWAEKDVFLLPIVTQNGLCGLNLFNLYIPRRQAIIGFGYKAVMGSHGGIFTALTDRAFHDFIHAYAALLVSDTKGYLTFIVSSPLKAARLSFLSHAEQVTYQLIQKYQLARRYEEKKRLGACNTIMKSIIMLFQLLHEIDFYDPKVYDTKASYKKDFQKIVEEDFFYIDTLQKEDDVPLDQEDIKLYMFRNADVYFLLSKVYPSLKEAVHQCNMRVEKGALIVTKEPFQVTGKQMYAFSRLLLRWMLCLWEQFKSDCSKEFKNTLPFFVSP